MSAHISRLALPAILALSFAYGSTAAAQDSRAEVIAVEHFVLHASHLEQGGPSGMAAAGLFTSEFKARMKVEMATTPDAPAEDQKTIIFALRNAPNQWPFQPPADFVAELATLKPEGYGILLDTKSRKAPTLWVIGADGRGLLYGAGALLRNLVIGEGLAVLPIPFKLVTSPAYGLRGHQIGFRNQANSWDAWTIPQMDQYIRDQIVFGANAIENIPFQDEDPITLPKVSRHDMNIAMSKICADFGIEHWVWTPVEFDLKDAAKRAAELKVHEDFYTEAPRLDGVFFPGGDPGSNSASLVLPFLKDIAELLKKTHPQAKVWLSMQYFNKSDQAMVYKWLEDDKPEWFGGLVCGPSSPPIRETRAKLDPRYKLRFYPDITHTVRCQFPVANWDRAFNLTLGRECVNYRPAAELYIHNLYSAWTDGFLSYSDGVHDDANKILWSLAAWDPNVTPREAMIQYARYFIDGGQATRLADAMLALEKNWEGPIVENGAIDATAREWEALESALPAQAAGNWRMQMALFRASYDEYQRQRQIREAGLQRRANEVLSTADKIGSAAAITAVTSILNEPWQGTRVPNLRKRIDDIAKSLFDKIQLQTSVPRFKANGSERGCSMDFVDFPLNDRLYFEYRVPQIQALADEAQKVKELKEFASWADGGPGGFYDDIGNIGAQPHALLERPWRLDPEADDFPNTEFMFANGGQDIRRLAVQDWQAVDAMRYTGLDPKASYRVIAGLAKGPLTKAQGMIRVTANGKDAEWIEDPALPPAPEPPGKFGGAFIKRSWRIPAGAAPEGELRIEWIIKGSDGEGKVARHPELAEVWLVKE